MSYYDILKVMAFAIGVNWIVYLNIFGQISDDSKIKKISYSLAMFLSLLCGSIIILL